MKICRSKRPNRHSFLRGLLQFFSHAKKAPASMGLQIFVADNLAQFAYEKAEEPLYIIHQITSTLSHDGSILRKVPHCEWTACFLTIFFL
jgi:hypothetical protein